MNKGIHVTDNKKLKRFETEVNGDFAYVEYGHYRKSLVLIHTFVPVAARGEGLAMKLAKYVLDLAMENDIKIVPICPVVSKYLELHPRYKALVDTTYPYKKKL